MGNILVTGASGQIGSELTSALRAKYGTANVLVTDIRKPAWEDNLFCELDVRNLDAIKRVLSEYKITVVYHMAAILSATGEAKMDLAWQVNMQGVYNVLEACREHKVEKIFIPSSIAVFGPDSPKENTPQDTVLHPQTLYGITKAAGEMLGNYYVKRFGMDIRGVRYPGIISSETLPGGGTTDYAVEIYYKAIESKHYTCFVREDTVLPMVYMPDVIAGTIQLMETPKQNLVLDTNFNIASMSFSVSELVTSIQQHIPDFRCDFAPDHRQQYADSWPKSIDDQAARQQWGWQPKYDLDTMTQDMLEKLRAKHI